VIWDSDTPIVALFSQWSVAAVHACPRGQDSQIIFSPIPRPKLESPPAHLPGPGKPNVYWSGSLARNNPTIYPSTAGPPSFPHFPCLLLAAPPTNFFHLADHSPSLTRPSLSSPTSATARLPGIPLLIHLHLVLFSRLLGFCFLSYCFYSTPRQIDEHHYHVLEGDLGRFICVGSSLAEAQRGWFPVSVQTFALAITTGITPRPRVELFQCRGPIA